MKKAYQTHPETRELLAEISLTESPLEPGIYLIPADAYEDAPPPSVPGKAIIRAENGWLHVDDHRGIALYDSNGVEYGFSGNYNGLGPIPDWLSTEPPAPEPEPTPEPPMPEPSAQLVTRAQGKAALTQAGLWSQILEYVELIEDPTEQALANIALHDTIHWQRSSPFLNAAAAALGLTDEQIDELFITAAQIQL